MKRFALVLMAAALVAVACQGPVQTGVSETEVTSWSVTAPTDPVLIATHAPIEAGGQRMYFNYEARVVVGDDDLPLLVYAYPPAGEFHLIKCSDPWCTGPRSTTKVPADPGDYQALLLPDGRPVVLYDEDNQAEPPDEHRVDLMMLRCDDSTCTSYQSSVITSGQNPSADVGPDGVLTVVYNGMRTETLEGRTDIIPDGVYLLRCPNGDCRDVTPVRVLGPEDDPAASIRSDPGVFGLKPLMDLKGDGNPLIVFRSGTGLVPVVAVLDCADPYCSQVEVDLLPNPLDLYMADFGISPNGLATLVLDGDECHIWTWTDDPQTADITFWPIETQGTNLAFTSQGLPILASGQPDIGPMLTICEDTACDRTTVIQLGELVLSPVLALDSDTNPVLTWWEPTELFFLHCDTPDCAAHALNTTPLES